jgi:hypothetical protein
VAAVIVGIAAIVVLRLLPSDRHSPEITGEADRPAEAADLTERELDPVAGD